MLLARLSGPTGQIVCFEPSPENAAQIRRNARLNGFAQVIVREEAIGDHEGRESLMMDRFPAMNRLALLGSQLPDQCGTLEVRLRTLDSLASEAPEIRRPSLIKMDIEGAEVVALLGARALLSEARPVLLIELHGTNSVIMQVLRDLGYDARVVPNPLLPDQHIARIEDAHWNVHILCNPLPD